MSRRLLASAVIALGWLLAAVGTAPPASAHSVSGVGATNWRTVLTGVTPRLPGVTLSVVENGSRLELVNHGPEIVVFGYEREPYLRVGPAGVFINTASPAAYLNCSRKGCPVPASADAAAPPRWEQISTGQTILWHDHRTHWMGSRPPPDVAAAPGVTRVQAHWAVTMAEGTTVITATGYYEWIPGPSAFPWLVLIAGLVALGLVMALTRSLHWLAAATGALAVVDFSHAVAVAWFWAGNTTFRIAELFDGSSYQLPGWILGGAAVALLWRFRALGAKFAVVVGLSAVVFTGLFDFTVLNRSQAPFDGPIVVDRICVCLCLGLGLGIGLGALWLLRTDRPPPRDADLPGVTTGAPG